MGDLIISEYEKTRTARQSDEQQAYGRGLAVLTLTIMLLVLNQIYTNSLIAQTALNVIGFGTAFLLFYCQQTKQRQAKKSLTEYSEDMECMERVLYCLDIDTYNKLGLVLDEVKSRINDEEQERKRKEKIIFLGIASVAGTLSILCVYWESHIMTYLKAGSILNFFLALATLLLACVYVGARMYSSNRKYKWLYEILLNVMITKF